MKSRDFVYWLQGFMEINEPKEIDEKQTEIIKRHLNLVFKHEIDPEMGDEAHQEELNKIHNNKFPTTEEECVEIYGPKPGPNYEFNLHGWYHPDGGQPRC